MLNADSEKTTSPDIEAYQAMKLLDAGEVQEAIEKCHEAVARFGPNRNCYLVKARAHIELEEYGFAEKALQSVLSLDPEHPAAWAMLGEVYYRLGNKPKVDYCKNRLESIFPVLVENLEQTSADEDEKSEVQEVAEANHESTADTIVPLEDLAKDETVQKQAGDSGSYNEIVKDINEDVNQPSSQTEDISPPARQFGLKTEIFETATFADICLKQGKFEKAKQIYMKLLNDDPENLLYKEKLKIIESKMGSR